MPPTFGRPTPFEASATLCLCMRSFSNSKYQTRIPQVITKSPPAFHEKGCPAFVSFHFLLSSPNILLISYPIGISGLGLLDSLVLGSSLGNWLSRLDGGSWKRRAQLLWLEGAAGEATLALSGRKLFGKHALKGFRGRDRFRHGEWLRRYFSYPGAIYRRRNLMFRSFNLSISKAPNSPADILPGHAQERHTCFVCG